MRVDLRRSATPTPWSGYGTWVVLDYRQPGASHVVFSFPGFDPLSVPAKKPIKPIYVRLFVKLIDQILEARQ